jgi:uncharacterized membrane protein affecting hemolysin expression
MMTRVEGHDMLPMLLFIFGVTTILILFLMISRQPKRISRMSLNMLTKLLPRDDNDPEGNM